MMNHFHGWTMNRMDASANSINWFSFFLHSFSLEFHWSGTKWRQMLRSSVCCSHASFPTYFLQKRSALSNLRGIKATCSEWKLFKRIDWNVFKNLRSVRGDQCCCRTRSFYFGSELINAFLIPRVSLRSVRTLLPYQITFWSCRRMTKWKCGQTSEGPSIKNNQCLYGREATVYQCQDVLSHNCQTKMNHFIQISGFEWCFKYVFLILHLI